jgi:hypothetical protein
MSVDLRTRTDSEQALVEADLFFRETLPAQFDAHQHLITPGASELDLSNFCIEIDGEAWTLSWKGDRCAVSAGKNGSARVTLSPEQFTDIVNDQSTPIALMSNGLLDMPQGGLPDFLNWWLILRSALDGRRIHAHGDIDCAIDTRKRFTPDDSDEEMRDFLEQAGFLHIRGMFSEDEMAAVAADYDRAAPNYEKGDPKAWFATTHTGDEHLVRMEGFDRYSDTAKSLIEEGRYQRIGGIPGCGHTTVREPGNLISALQKPIGIVKGISDLPWHKDCSLGRHSYECCNLVVGISVDGADAESGQLRVLPGSHRALMWPAPCVQPGLDLEPIDLPTETGDVTIHLSCTLHMSQSPVKRTRKVLYTGFGQTAADAELARANRERVSQVRSKTHTTMSQHPGYLGD